MLEAARHGWPVLGCDAKHRRRRRPAERAALIEAGVQNFILNGNVSALENVERVLHNLAAILAACTTPGRSSTASIPRVSNDFRSTDRFGKLSESVVARVVADVVPRSAMPKLAEILDVVIGVAATLPASWPRRSGLGLSPHQGSASLRQTSF